LSNEGDLLYYLTTLPTDTPPCNRYSSALCTKWPEISWRYSTGYTSTDIWNLHL